MLATNPASIEMQDGMVQEGVLRKRALVDGKEVDELMFAMLRWEWNARSWRQANERGWPARFTSPVTEA